MQSMGINGNIAKSMQSYYLKIEIWDAENYLCDLDSDFCTDHLKEEIIQRHMQKAAQGKYNIPG